MKLIFCLVVFGLTTISATNAQNSFPCSGNVGIGTLSPMAHLEITNGPATLPGGWRRGLRIAHENLIELAGSSTNFLSGVNGNTLTHWMYFTGDNSLVQYMMVGNNGNVGIGTTINPATLSYKLSVGGSVIAEKYVAKLQSNWPDFVFADQYKLMPLPEVEAFIKNEKHLPGIPAAAAIEKNGQDIGDMNIRLLQKVEELTLHLIEINKANQRLAERVRELETKLAVVTTNH